MIKINSGPRTADCGQRGVAIIIAVAIIVAITMLTVAMLGVVRRSQSTARAYKVGDLLHIALLSAKAQAANYAIDKSLFGTFNGFTDTKFIYDLDAYTGVLDDRTYDGASFVDEFKPAEASFYAKTSTAYYADAQLNFVAAADSPPPPRARYKIATRTFLLPLDAAFLINYVYKYDGKNYPFPRLFDGTAALAKNMLPLYTDLYAGFNAGDYAYDSGKKPNVQNEFTLDDYIVKNLGTLDKTDDYLTKAVNEIIIAGSVNNDYAKNVAGKILTVAAIKAGPPASATLPVDEITAMLADTLDDEHPYKLLSALPRLAAASNEPDLLARIDAARIVANAGNYLKSGAEANAKIEQETLAPLDFTDNPVGGMEGKINNYFDGAAASAKKAELMYRVDWETTTELGVSFSLFNGNANTVAEMPVFTGGAPYNTLQFVDPALTKITDGIPHPHKIPLTINTPEWLVAAGIGWQLFNSPTAQDRMAAQLLSGYAGGAIYRIDISATNEPAYVFDQRRIFKDGVANSNDKGDMIMTPYSFHVNGAQIASSGNANYRAFPPPYGGYVREGVSCADKEKVKWEGWDPTEKLDLLGFAGGKNNQFSNSYLVNAASPFGEKLGSGDERVVDKRTGTFAGTGTYVRPSVPADITDLDFWRYGRMAIYGNTLRTHNELAQIVKLVNAYKGDDDPAATIIGKILTDPIVGYVPKVPAFRQVLARNPYEGVVIWAAIPDASGKYNYEPVGTTGTTSPKWDVTPTGSIAADAFHLLSPFAAMMTQSGSGITADRGIETFMEGSQGNGPAGRSPTPGGWSVPYGKYIVDNYARDWDGTVFDANSSSSTNRPPYYPVEPTLYIDQHPPLKNEMNFSDSYFNTNPGVWVPRSNTINFNGWAGTNGNLGGSTSAGSAFQGMDVKMSKSGGFGGGDWTGGTGAYAEPAWYRDNLIHLPRSSVVNSVNGTKGVVSGPVFYCDNNDFTATPTITGDNGAGKIISLTAPPYQFDYGRWDRRIDGNWTATVKAIDLPGYGITNGNLKDDTAKYYAPNGNVLGLDATRQGTLYRNDDVKLTSMWRWNWGRWVQVAPSGSSVNKTGIYTFVVDNGQIGRRKIVFRKDYPALSDAAGEPRTASPDGSGVLSFKAYKYLNVYPTNTDTPRQTQNDFDGLNGKIVPHYQVFYAPSTDDENYTGLNGSIIYQPGVYMIDADVMLNSNAVISIDSSNDLFIDGVKANIAPSGEPKNSSNGAAAYVGRFVKRQATFHRWKPAVGTTYPIFAEINPQAIKNAAIERVIVNLFGWNDEVKAAMTAGLKQAYVNWGFAETEVGTGSPLRYLTGTGEPDSLDLVEPLFHYAPTAKFYRIINAAALIDRHKEEVISYRTLEFIYRRGTDGTGAVVDQHFLDLE